MFIGWVEAITVGSFYDFEHLFSLRNILDVFYSWDMKKSTSFRTGRHCVFTLHVHLVFVTKYRRRVFTKRVLKELCKIFSDICQDFESELIEFNGEYDHVHLLIHYPPKVSISKLVNCLKGVSSRLIRKKNYPEIHDSLWGKSLWSSSYFAGSCGGASISMIQKYIEHQCSSEDCGLTSPS